MTWVGLPTTLRERLTLWSTLVVLASLLVYSGVVYVSLREVLWDELDERLHNDIETLEGLLQPFWTPQGVRLPPGESPLDADDFRWLQVWNHQGRLLFVSTAAAAQPITALTVPPVDRAVSIDLGEDGTVRVKEEAGHIGGDPVIVRAVTSEARLHEEVAEFLWLVSLAVPVVTALAAFGSHHLVRRTLRPVDQLVASTSAVTAERLDVRVPVINANDEVGRVAGAFNATLARLHAAFEQMRRCTANASHELRTPLAALRATGQTALAHTDQADCRDAVVSMLEDAEQLSRVLDTMLLLAQAEAGTIPVHYRQVDIDALVTDIVGECDVLAQDKAQRITLSCHAGQASVDAAILRIAVANIVHNAIRYGPPSSDVEVRTFADHTNCTIEVADRGPGIAAEHQSLVFERFYRVDHGRSRTLGGVGLGLAMARWSVEMHGGHIQMTSREGHGSTFRIVLPRSPLSHRADPERLDS